MGGFVQLAIQVLTETKDKMSPEVIWHYAIDKDFDRSFSKNAKTPVDTLRSRVQTEINEHGVNTPLRCEGNPRLYYVEYNAQTLQTQQHAQVQQAQKLGDVLLLKKIRARQRKQGRRPTRKIVTTTDFVRDANVVAYVRLRANCMCEMPGCTWQGFEMDDGSRYIEVHHLQWLSAEGDDTPENAAALCPNCHRLLHHGKDRAAQLDRLRAALSQT